MGRLILLVLLVAVGLLWWQAGRKARLREPKAESSSAPKAGRGVQEMVACAHCGLQFPRSEAVADAQGRLHCSRAHADADSQGPA